MTLGVVGSRRRRSWSFAARELGRRVQRRDRGAARRVRTSPDDGPTEPIGAPGAHDHARSRCTGIPAIRNFFRTNETPVYFVSATAFNLLGIDRWVRNFRFVNYYDSFDGTHPNVFVPKEQTPRAFESIEEIVNYLLGHKEIGDLVTATAARARRRS